MGKYYVKVSGMRGPEVPHRTLDEAYIEARRLFVLHEQTRRVYVLEAIGSLNPENILIKDGVPSRQTAAG